MAQSKHWDWEIYIEMHSAHWEFSMLQRPFSLSKSGCKKTHWKVFSVIDFVANQKLAMHVLFSPPPPPFTKYHTYYVIFCYLGMLNVCLQIDVIYCLPLVLWIHRNNKCPWRRIHKHNLNLSIYHLWQSFQLNAFLNITIWFYLTNFQCLNLHSILKSCFSISKLQF